MEAQKVLRERRSIRNFKNEKIDRSIIKDIIETTTYAPTWTNSQPMRYTVIENELIKSKIAEQCFEGFASNVKITNRSAGIIVLTYVNGLSGRSPLGQIISSKGDSWSMFDSGVAANQLALAAHDRGVATVIIGAFDEKKVEQIINIPEGEVVAALIAYGIEESHPNAPKRKTLDEIARFID